MAELYKQKELAFFFGILLFFVMSCTASNPSATEKHPNYSPQDLEGDWKLIKVTYIEEKQLLGRFMKNAQPNVSQEWTPPVFLDDNGVLRPDDPKTYLSPYNRSLHIIKDTLYQLYFPLQLRSKSTFSLKGEQLKYGQTQRKVKVSDDKKTLKLSYHDDYGLYLVETYEKVHFDKSTLMLLKKYSLNYPLLAGKWELIRQEALGWGEQYNLDFPYTITDTLHLTKEELTKALLGDQSCLVFTNGKPSKYFIQYDDNELHLVPDSWYDHKAWLESGYDNPFYLRYRRLR